MSQKVNVELVLGNILGQESQDFMIPIFSTTVLFDSSIYAMTTYYSMLVNLEYSMHVKKI